MYHLDLDPSNIMINNIGKLKYMEVRIIDFGFIKDIK